MVYRFGDSINAKVVPLEGKRGLSQREGEIPENWPRQNFSNLNPEQGLITKLLEVEVVSDLPYRKLKHARVARQLRKRGLSQREEKDRSIDPDRIF
jgi:hypothetical protein